MSKVMVVVEWPGGPPTVRELCERYGLSRSDFDADFGVVEVDPERSLYSVLVDEKAAASVDPAHASGWSAPMSNPPIEPFGGEDV